jgi:plastocyanin
MRMRGTSMLLAAAVLALAAGGARADEGRVVGVRAVAVAPQPAGEAPAARTAAASAVPAAAPAATAVDEQPIARAAASGGVTISDFAFHPGTTTVHVGDTISWTNEDAASHTATADDGSFDTGTLARGASGSHAFASAGTFAYHCTIHPSMHGTVTVLAAAQSGSAPAPASPAAPTQAASAPTLPNTGVNAPGLALLGFGLLLLGLLLRGLSGDVWRAS